MSKPTKPLPSFEEVDRQLLYEPLAGTVCWKVRNSNRIKVGDRAGYKFPATGYLGVSLNGTRYLLHRIIWLLAYKEDPGAKEVDHINNNRTDNRLDNLRLVTPGENLCNVGLKSNNTSGVKGVFWSSKKRRWVAKFEYQKRVILVGQYEDLDKATIAIRLARASVQGSFANHG